MPPHRGQRFMPVYAGFRILLTRYDGARRMPAMETPAPRVLIVDDDPSFRSIVRQLLEDKGYDAVAVGSDDEAGAQAASGTFSVAVVDLVMPGLGGLALGDRLKAVSPDTQVLILTGNPDMRTAIQGIQHGVFDYLEKSSIDVARLERSIQEAAGKSLLLKRNRGLMQQLQESNRLLRSLHEVTAGLAGEPHLDRVLAKVVDEAKALSRAAAGRALLFERTGADSLLIEVSAGDGASTLPGVRLSVKESILALAVETGRAVTLDRPVEHPRYSRRCDELPTALPGLVCAPITHGRALGVLMVGGREAPFTAEDGELLAILGRHAGAGVENALQQERAINFFTHMSEILVSFLEKTDVFYRGHSRRVTALADMLTRRMGLAEPERRNIHFGALLHDIGKLNLDPTLLTGSSLSPEQIRTMREHPSRGVELLRPITMLEEVLPVIHSHHERWDGQGYPLGLTGEAIPIGARVVSVADAFDAMTRERPHASRRTAEEALVEIETFAGTQFDPRIARLFAAEYRLRGEELPA
jgi:putative nucleotidyltransferase with HDIG domain